MTSFRFIAASGLLTIVLACAVRVDAQTSGTQPAGQPPPAAPVQTGYQDGFFIQSANGDNRLVFNFVAQIDGRFALGDPPPITNSFTVRKFRPTFSGRVARYFDFKFMPDLANGNAVIQDAYFDFRFSPAFRLRTGKEKTPIGYELLVGDAYLAFPERSLASSLVPNRDVGVQLQGDLANAKVFYAGGLFNGIPDGTTSATEMDTNSAKDFAGRVVVQPFRSADTPARPQNGLGFQLGGSAGEQLGPLPAFRTSSGQTYFSYAGGVSPSAASGDRTRITPAVFYVHKSFWGFGEYVRSAQQVSRDGVETEVANDAWEIAGTYLLTGEASSSGIIRPSKPFDPTTGQWGALQLVARYAVLTVDQAAFDAGLAAATASGKAESFTIGANWFPNQSVKVYGNYEQTKFSGGNAVRPTEKLIIFRTQLAF